MTLKQINSFKFCLLYTFSVHNGLDTCRKSVIIIKIGELWNVYFCQVTFCEKHFAFPLCGLPDTMLHDITPELCNHSFRLCDKNLCGIHIGFTTKEIVNQKLYFLSNSVIIKLNSTTYKIDVRYSLVSGR